ncbi:hypothetical protein Tco_0351390 [Tanacetum coccineum]
MEIKKKKEVHGFYANIEYDPSSEDFAKWLASKFYNHTKMNWYTNNALWMYWIKGDDEVLLTDEKVSDLGGKNLDEENKIVELLKIEDDIFNFETPLCKDFKLVPSCCVIFDLKPLSLSFDFVFSSKIFKSFPFSLDNLCLDNLDIFKEDLEYQSLRKSLSLSLSFLDS